VHAIKFPIVKSKIKWHPEVSAAILLPQRSWSKNTEVQSKEKNAQVWSSQLKSVLLLWISAKPVFNPPNQFYLHKLTGKCSWG